MSERESIFSLGYVRFAIAFVMALIAWRVWFARSPVNAPPPAANAEDDEARAAAIEDARRQIDEHQGAAAFEQWEDEEIARLKARTPEERRVLMRENCPPIKGAQCDELQLTRIMVAAETSAEETSLRYLRTKLVHDFRAAQ